MLKSKINKTCSMESWDKKEEHEAHFRGMMLPENVKNKVSDVW